MRVDGLVTDAAAVIKTKRQLLNLPKIPGINVTCGEDLLAHLYVLVKSTWCLWKLFHSGTYHFRARLRRHAAWSFAWVMFGTRQVQLTGRADMELCSANARCLLRILGRRRPGARSVRTALLGRAQKERQVQE